MLRRPAVLLPMFLLPVVLGMLRNQSSRYRVDRNSCPAAVEATAHPPASRRPMQIPIPVPVVIGPTHDGVDPEPRVEDQLQFVLVSPVAMAMSRSVRRRSVALREDRRRPLGGGVVDAAPERSEKKHSERQHPASRMTWLMGRNIQHDSCLPNLPIGKPEIRRGDAAHKTNRNRIWKHALREERMAPQERKIRSRIALVVSRSGRTHGQHHEARLLNGPGLARSGRRFDAEPNPMHTPSPDFASSNATQNRRRHATGCPPKTSRVAE